MMNCREVTESASDYLERRLGFWRRAGVMFHLAMCKGCRAYVKQLRVAMEALRSLGRTKPSATVPDERLLEAFRKQPRAK